MSNPGVYVDMFPGPKSFGWFGLFLFLMGIIIIIIIWTYYDLMAAIICFVLWVNGVYIGRSIESHFFKHRKELSKKIEEVYNEKKTG